MSEEGQGYIARMQGAAERMQSLVDDILKYARVTTKTETLELIDLEAIVAEVLIDLEIRIQEKQARVEVGQLPHVLADKMQMRQLFQNLISNALKYSKDSVPSIIIIQSHKADNGFWEITVQDNGIGFDEKFLDKIFQPFQRLHKKNEYEGTGMGLAICEKIVYQCGGRITAKSHLGNGATFFLTVTS